MNHRNLTAALLAAAVLAVAACGGGDDEQHAEQETDLAFGTGSITSRDVPSDFPDELAPPEYDTAEYVDMTPFNGTRAVAFESTANVEESIDHYTGLLGEPTINVDSGDGDRMVQWHESPHPPWVVGVMGNAGETIVTVSTIPEQ